MSETRSQPKQCDKCGIEFEPKTRVVTHDTETGVRCFYHAGCARAIVLAREANREDRCHHYICAEDMTSYAFMHRKYGCPAEGAEWPRATKALGFD